MATARPPVAAAERRRRLRCRFEMYLLVGAAALAAARLLGALWRRLVRPRLDEPQFVRDIFEHYFAYGSGRDPLRLRFRPVLPTLGGRRLSLHQAQRLADRGRLLGARPGCPMLAGLNRRRDTLDRAAPLVELLEPYLPPVTWLEDVAGILAAPPLPPTLREAEALIRRRDPLFRLHLLPGSADFREVYLPFRAAAAGRRHVVVGDRASDRRRDAAGRRGRRAATAPGAPPRGCWPRPHSTWARRLPMTPSALRTGEAMNGNHLHLSIDLEAELRKITREQHPQPGALPGAARAARPDAPAADHHHREHPPPPGAGAGWRRLRRRRVADPEAAAAPRDAPPDLVQTALSRLEECHGVAVLSLFHLFSAVEVATAGKRPRAGRGRGAPPHRPAASGRLPDPSGP